MKTFTDRQGRSWTIEVNYTSLRRVKAAAGVDLTKLVDPQADIVGQLTGDPFVLFDCLVAILQPQLDERGLTAEQFGESLDEESADKAAVALIEAAIDFFQEAKRMLLKRAFAKVTTAAQRRQTASLDQARRAVESPEFERAIERSLESVVGSLERS
uniref:Uncharacterized protein n=1 Tax=Schlesneria paludicola TaxID=360056 RepID=A0A7C4LQZ7_9PLAN